MPDGPASTTSPETALPVEKSDRYRMILGIVVGPRYALPVRMRVAWGIAGLVCATVLGTAVYLKPSPAGHGTHEGLGLPPCGFIVRSGFPCPTCGMTTAFSLFVRGRWIAAFLAQPTGFILAAMTVALMVWSWSIAATGMIHYVDWDRASVRLMTILGALIVLGWGFVMARGLTIGTLPWRGN